MPTLNWILLFLRCPLPPLCNDSTFLWETRLSRNVDHVLVDVYLYRHHGLCDSCKSDVPSQWKGWNFHPHSCHIFQPILMKLEIEKDTWDTTPTPHAKFGWCETTGMGSAQEEHFPLLSVFYLFFLYSCSRLQVIPEDRSRQFMAQNACFRVR